MSIRVQTSIPDGTTWQDATGRTWTVNGTDLVFVFGVLEGTLTVAQVKF